MCSWTGKGRCIAAAHPLVGKTSGGQTMDAVGSSSRKPGWETERNRSWYFCVPGYLGCNRDRGCNRDHAPDEWTRTFGDGMLQQPSVCPFRLLLQVRGAGFKSRPKQ